MVDPPGRPRRSAVSIGLFLLLLLTVGAVVGAASAFLRGPTYTSEAQLSWNPSVRSQIDPNYTAPDPTTFDREVADQRDVILSDDVIGRVVRSLRVDAATVRAGLSVSTTAGRSEILVSGSGRDPKAAQDLTRAATDAYVVTLRNRNSATLKQRSAALKPVIAQLRRQLAAAGAGSGALADDIAQLQSQQAGYTVAAGDVPVEAAVQRQAARPEGPSSLSPVVTAGIGGVLGLILGVCIVLLLSGRRPEAALPVRVTTPSGVLQRQQPPAGASSPRPLPETDPHGRPTSPSGTPSTGQAATGREPSEPPVEHPRAAAAEPPQPVAVAEQERVTDDQSPEDVPATTPDPQ